MKFTCNQLTLLKGINTISKALATRTTMPILKGILLDVNESGILTLSASDLDLTIEQTIELSNYQKGKTVVPAKIFSDIIRKLPNEEIYFDIKENKMNIKCLNSKFDISLMDAEQFPKIEINKDNYINETINKNIFKEMINKTSFAASNDISSGTLNGILIEIENNNIKTVAIDGYKLAIANQNIINKNNTKIIILARILNEISKILNENDITETVDLIVTEKHAIIKIDETTIISTLIDGKFVDFERILPKESTILVNIDRKDLLDSLNRASIISNGGNNNSIKLNIYDQFIEINSESEIGKVEESVFCEKIGENIEIAFNGNYLMDILKVIEDDRIIMKFVSKRNPCLIEPIEGNEYKYMLSPVRS